MYPGLFVAAAGNENQNIDLGDNCRYPASYQLANLLTVGGTELNDQKTVDPTNKKGSNYGSRVDIYAPDPASGIVSTFPTSSCARGLGYCQAGGSIHVDSGCHIWGGTSMAAPQVAAVAALILSINNSIPRYELRFAITSNADHITISAGGSSWNTIRLNAYKALLSVAPGGIKNGQKYFIKNRGTGQYMSVNNGNHNES